jgi:ATP-binding cassette, subfamily B, multidrug efflux pump
MSPVRRLLYYFHRYRTSLIIGAACVFGSVLFSLIKPLIIREAIDQLVLEISSAVLIQFGLLLIGASIVEGIFLFLQRRIIIGASRHIEYDMRGDFYDHLQALPLTFYQHQRTGDLMSRATNDLSNVRMLIGPAVMHAFSALLVVGGSFIMMLQIDRQLALLALFAVPVVGGTVKYFGEKIHDRSREVQDHFGNLSARVQENLAGVRVVRAFGQEENELATFGGLNRGYVDRNRALIRITATFYPLLQFVIGILFVVVFYIGGQKILAGTMTIGSFVAFQFYLARMVWPLIAVGWVINLFQRGMASMKRLDEIWSSPPDAEPLARALEAPLEGRIEIRDLTFTYEKERPVLRNISLQVEPGQTIGIVGRTGSGKSTLLALLARLYEAPPGTLFIDDRPIETIPVRELRQMIGMVPQETFLFSETIAENIRFGRDDADAEQVRQMADLAGLTTDLASFPRGLETMVGERGITLSGGQKQRTAIARAIIRNPAILLLDDSLSAVDTATEERILRSLREVRRGRTVLIVSHRVSSVKDADQILVLDAGEVVERGTHEQLLEREGWYSELYRRQALEEAIEEIA